MPKGGGVAFVPRVQEEEEMQVRGWVRVEVCIPDKVLVRYRVECVCVFGKRKPSETSANKYPSFTQVTIIIFQVLP